MTRVDAQTNAVKHIEVPRQAFATYYVTTGGGAAWVETPNVVYRIDGKTLRVTNALELRHGNCSSLPRRRASARSRSPTARCGSKTTERVSSFA